MNAYRYWFFPCVTLLLCGCIGERVPVAVNYLEHKQQLVVSARVLEKNISEELFGADLVDYSVIPVQVQIQNNGPHTYTMYPSYIDAPHANIEALKNQLQYDTGWYATMLTVPSFIWLWQAIPLVVFPACVHMNSHNKRVTENVDRYSYHTQENIVVHPYEQVSFVLLLDALKCSPLITMNIFDNETEELLPFTMELKDR